MIEDIFFIYYKFHYMFKLLKLNLKKSNKINDNCLIFKKTFTKFGYIFKK